MHGYFQITADSMTNSEAVIVGGISHKEVVILSSLTVSIIDTLFLKVWVNVTYDWEIKWLYIKSACLSLRNNYFMYQHEVQIRPYIPNNVLTCLVISEHAEL